MFLTTILGLAVAVCAFIAGATTDTHAIFTKTEKSSRLFNLLTAIALGLLIASSAYHF